MIPIYEYKCPECGGYEELFLHMRDSKKEILCKNCSIVMKKLLSVVAKTASLWNDGWNKGLDGQGVFSHALGKKVHSKREESKILEAK